MSMLEALECALDYIGQELGITDVKQVLIEYESSDLLTDGVWVVTLLPKGLETPDISDIVRVRIDEMKQRISVVAV